MSSYVFPEERDILHFNATLHGMSMSDYARQTRLSVRLWKTSKEKRRLCELARIGANINQFVKRDNETFIESVNASVSQAPCKRALSVLA